MTTKNSSTTLWDDIDPTEDAPRLPRSTRGAWRAPVTAPPRAPQRPAKLPGFDELSQSDDEASEEAPASRRGTASRRLSVPRASARTDVREFSVTGRRLLPQSRYGWIVLGIGGATLLGLMVSATVLFRRYLLHDVHFDLMGSQQITSLGSSGELGARLTPVPGGEGQVTRAEVLSVFGRDIGRSLFFVPLAERRRALEAIPWVRQATVMRMLPDRILVHIVERTPIAFAREGDTVELVDAEGVLLPVSPMRMALHHYSFPVITGLNMHPTMASPEERMTLYQRFLADLDHAQSGASTQISEIDLSDPADLRATLSSGGTDLLIHFGADDFAARYQMFRAHIAEWQARYPRLIGVDMRFPGDVPLELAAEPAKSADTTSGNAGNASAKVGTAASAAVKQPGVGSKAVSLHPPQTTIRHRAALHASPTKKAGSIAQQRRLRHPAHPAHRTAHRAEAWTARPTAHPTANPGGMQ